MTLNSTGEITHLNTVETDSHVYYRNTCEREGGWRRDSIVSKYTCVELNRQDKILSQGNNFYLDNFTIYLNSISSTN